MGQGQVVIVTRSPPLQRSRPMTRPARFPLLLALLLGLGLVSATGCVSNRDAAAERGAGGALTDDGYGTYDERDHLGGASEVDVDSLHDAPRSLAEMLRGRIAGVVVTEQPGGITVRIRGTGTIHGSSEPLYVVDGVALAPRPGGVLSVHPADIDRITVLKGPEASIYGARGANGVVVIRTKRGG